MAANPYRYLPVATIQSRLDAYLAAELAILGGAQSYSLNGVSLTRANLTEIKTSIGQLSQAYRLATGQAVTSVIANTSGRCFSPYESGI